MVPASWSGPIHTHSQGRVETFPGESVRSDVRESASLMDLSAEECFLIRVEDAEPIIAVKRFDRVTPDTGRSVDGLPIPYRLHQEDVCQAKGISRELKYEPTGVNYLGLIVDAVRRRRRIKWRTGSLSAITSCSTMP